MLPRTVFLQELDLGVPCRLVHPLPFLCLSLLSTLPTGFFLFDTLDCLDMYFTFEVVEETLFVHHILGIILYVFSLTTQSYMFLTSIVLVQVSQQKK